jgi:SNF2 family DNA or RNA helicase
LVVCDDHSFTIGFSTVHNCHRIGQEADSVTAYYLIAPGTVDEDLMALINNKYNTINQIMDGKVDTDIFGDSMLKELLKKYGEKSII